MARRGIGWERERAGDGGDVSAGAKNDSLGGRESLRALLAGLAGEEAVVAHGGFGGIAVLFPHFDDDGRPIIIEVCFGDDDGSGIGELQICVI